MFLKGSAVGAPFRPPGTSGETAGWAQGFVGLSRTGSRECAISRGDACGHAVGSVQYAMERGWSPGDAVGAALDLEAGGCAGL